MAGAAKGASDERHRTMVPGRSGSVEDVLNDAAGIVARVPVAVYNVLTLWYNKTKLE